MSEGSPRVYSTVPGSPASLLDPDAISRDFREDALAAAHSPTVPVCRGQTTQDKQAKFDRTSANLKRIMENTRFHAPEAILHSCF